MTDPKNLENWLHEKAGPAHDALKADPARAVSADRVRYTIDELRAQCDPSAELAAQEREWLDAPAVGRELLTPYDPAEALTTAEAWPRSWPTPKLLPTRPISSTPAKLRHVRGPCTASNSEAGQHRHFWRCCRWISSPETTMRDPRQGGVQSGRHRPSWRCSSIPARTTTLTMQARKRQGRPSSRPCCFR